LFFCLTLRVTIGMTEMARSLVRLIVWPEFEFQRIGRAHGDTGGTVITFLAKTILQRIQTKLAYDIAFFAIVTL
jgi:hypothetical protein